ncbi:MAG: pyridoxamine 5'-phosphate oxidase family protein [Elusimicrobiota bacterium]|jgi:general stress protein 26|nr:pyridoxamine 5'-phosphate oxidase family protein [Elusimicrobiota bacterium]
MKQKLQKLLSQNSFVELCTVNPAGMPETRAMINLRNKEIAPHLQGFFAEQPLNEIYFITNTSSAKIAHLAKNNKASVYLCDARTFEGILLLGDAGEVKDAAVKDAFWDDSWKMYYPAGKDGGDYSVLKFTARRYKFYNGQFKVKSGDI